MGSSWYEGCIRGASSFDDIAPEREKCRCDGECYETYDNDGVDDEDYQEALEISKRPGELTYEDVMMLFSRPKCDKGRGKCETNSKKPKIIFLVGATYAWKRQYKNVTAMAAVSRRPRTMKSGIIFLKGDMLNNQMTSQELGCYIELKI